MLHKLIVTGQELTPVEIYQGEVTERHDMATLHEEADVIVVHSLERCEDQLFPVNCVRFD